MMSGHGGNTISLIKNKDWTSRTLVNPLPPTSDNISFLSYPPSPPQSGRQCVSPLNLLTSLDISDLQRTTQYYNDFEVSFITFSLPLF